MSFLIIQEEKRLIKKNVTDNIDVSKKKNIDEKWIPGNKCAQKLDTET